MATVAKVIKRNSDGDLVVREFTEIGSMRDGSEQSYNPVQSAIDFIRGYGLKYSSDNKYHYSVAIFDTIAQRSNDNYQPKFLTSDNNYRLR